MYQGVTGFRNWMYDHRIRKAQTVNSKVISVGNVTVGGTGKTPVTLALIETLKEKGFSCGVVTRGYKRRKKGIHPVAVGPSAAIEFGDEPILIKKVYPDVPVMVGEKKVAAARKLLESDPVQFVICDDGFQHRALNRDLNILLLDATEAMKNYRVMPVGRGRESLLPALRRADYFVLTKTNLATSDQLKELIYFIKDHSEKPVLLGAYVLNGFRSMRGDHVENLTDSAYLISGVARPETIEGTIDGHVKIVKHKTFPDHHGYTNLEIEAVLDEASKLQARWILTTAKDATKLSQFHNLRDKLWVIDMVVKFEGDVKPFYAHIDRLARTSD